MAIKPQNVIPVLKDKVINYPPTAATVIAGLDLSEGPYEAILLDSLDTDNDWEVIEFYFVVTTATNAADQNVILGTTARTVASYGTAVTADDNHFADNTTALNVVSAAGDKIQIPLLATSTTVPRVLKAGCMLWLTVADSLNTGKGYFGVRLRPQEKVHGNASKRGKISYPVNAAAQNPNA